MVRIRSLNLELFQVVMSLAMAGGLWSVVISQSQLVETPLFPEVQTHTRMAMVETPFGEPN